jgi:hypothetical protein
MEHDTPTPITDAIWKQKGGVDVDDLIYFERKLAIARDALKEILFIRREPEPLIDLDEARKIANQALTKSKP